MGGRRTANQPDRHGRALRCFGYRPQSIAAVVPRRLPKLARDSLRLVPRATRRRCSAARVYWRRYRARCHRQMDQGFYPLAGKTIGRRVRTAPDQRWRSQMLVEPQDSCGSLRPFRPAADLRPPMLDLAAAQPAAGFPRVLRGLPHRRALCFSHSLLMAGPTLPAMLYLACPPPSPRIKSCPKVLALPRCVMVAPHIDVLMSCPPPTELAAPRGPALTEYPTTARPVCGSATSPRAH